MKLSVGLSVVLTLMILDLCISGFHVVVGLFTVAHIFGVVGRRKVGWTLQERQQSDVCTKRVTHRVAKFLSSVALNELRSHRVRCFAVYHDPDPTGFTLDQRTVLKSLVITSCLFVRSVPVQAESWVKKLYGCFHDMSVLLISRLAFTLDMPPSVCSAQFQYHLYS